MPGKDSKSAAMSTALTVLRLVTLRSSISIELVSPPLTLQSADGELNGVLAAQGMMKLRGFANSGGAQRAWRGARMPCLTDDIAAGAP